MNRSGHGVLTAAQAYLIWQRDIATSAARLDDLGRCSDWVTRWPGCPTLSAAPLSGTALDSLLASGPNKPTIAPESNRHARKPARENSLMQADRAKERAARPSDALGSVPPGHNSRAPQVLSVSREALDTVSARAVRELPPQANSALLTRWSPETPVTLENPARRPGTAAASPQRLSHPASVISKVQDSDRRDLVHPSGRASKPLSRTGEWLARAVQRVFEIIDPERAGAVPVSEQDAKVLASQWSARIAGPTAPPDVLKQLADANPEPEDLAQDLGKHPRSDRGLPPRAAGPMTEGSGPEWRDGIAHPLGGTALRAGTNLIEKRRANSNLPGPGENGYGQSEGIAPPLASSAPEQLTVPQETGEPFPPVASLMAREGALVEMMQSEPDLDVLAASIKRILDEQARRHGIDV